MKKPKRERAAKQSTRTKVTARSSKMGRKPKYDPTYPGIAEKLCSEQGYTDENLAVHFKVSKSTISKWKNDFSEFSEALKKGKDNFDSREVEQFLLKRCKGYSYVETTRELQTDDAEYLDEESEIAVQTLVVTKKVTKQVAPDVVAIIFWLKNRLAHRWSDKREIDHRIGEFKEPLTEEEIIERMKAIKKAGNGVDSKSIDGGSDKKTS